MAINSKHFEAIIFILKFHLQVRSDSMASVYSGAGEGRYGTVTVKGQVEFGMQYNYKQGALEIYVAQCKDLAAVDTKRNRSDPYVKVSTTSILSFSLTLLQTIKMANCIKRIKRSRLKQLNIRFQFKICTSGFMPFVIINTIESR